MLGLIDHGVPGRPHSAGGFECSNSQDDTYAIYFGLGQSLDLINAPLVFKVSLAGLRLGHYLVRSSDTTTLTSGFLDVGTGSGVHALLMRKLGGSDITATDISEKSIDQAMIHERLNFKKEGISFHVSNLFESIPKNKFHTIVFNPPGWRTPSTSLARKLESLEQEGQIPARAMFYGDEVIARFLEDLPLYLSPAGRAVIGLNSMVGIRDVLQKYNEKHEGTPPLSYRLMERHTFPLLYYSTQWQMLSRSLKAEFEQWSKQGLAAYSIDRNGEIYWSYEIIELVHRTT